MSVVVLFSQQTHTIYRGLRPLKVCSIYIDWRATRRIRTGDGVYL